eukprot:CAMPEP_0115245598 /NCGR_PEP_ID=MMETSP0270-20121206/40592_1 /TAXON_ID=71861 /ORGANISM="Scrippsiella trochoidea, Strain CCMP3099" /LENGTH=99 /DNA_ID=CAMNT_0002660783 /DNA_START=175 /DNA_END=470 /DNA_ORIENTATION=-
MTKVQLRKVAQFLGMPATTGTPSEAGRTDSTSGIAASKMKWSPRSLKPPGRLEALVVFFFLLVGMKLGPLLSTCTFSCIKAASSRRLVAGAREHGPALP